MFYSYIILFAYIPLVLAAALQGDYRNIFSIHGPGTYDGDDLERSIEAFEELVKHNRGSFYNIGDGKNTVPLDDIQDEFEIFSAGLKRPLVVYNGHSTPWQAGLGIELGAACPLPNSELLEALTESQLHSQSKAPISVLYTSCFGNDATKDVALLPLNSIVIGTACDQASGDDIMNWVNAFTQTWPTEITALGLLKSFLLQGLSTKKSPHIGVHTTSGPTIIVLEDLLKQVLGQKIPSDVIKKVKLRDRVKQSDDAKKNFAPRMTDFDAVAKAIHSSKHISQIRPRIYGPALVLALEYKKPALLQE